ncbi:MAG TPA: hypothetical protein VFG69_14815, partial [Nannocystaceae bacterium]|nr:hypothetical protein [Nannocystaceae bacterium]
RLIYKPLVAGATGALVLVALDLLLPELAAARVGAVVAALATYVAVLFSLGIAPEDRRLLRRRR